MDFLSLPIYFDVLEMYDAPLDAPGPYGGRTAAYGADFSISTDRFTDRQKLHSFGLLQK